MSCGGTITDLHESSIPGGAAIDREAGIVRGVKLLGMTSRNGRIYTASAVDSAAPLYEGAKVNFDHAKPGDGRRYSERFGVVKNVRREPDGLRGDIHFNPKNALAEQFVWDAEHATANAGMSHVVDARVTKRDGKSYVEQIKRVISVDVVADPATTNGLFESEKKQMDLQEQFDAQAAELKSLREQCAKLAEEIKARDEAEVAAKKLAEAAKAIDAAIAEAKLPEGAVTPAIRKLFESQPLDDVKAALKEMSASHAKRGERPQSKDGWAQESAGGGTTTESAVDFAKRLRR